MPSPALALAPAGLDEGERPGSPASPLRGDPKPGSQHAPVGCRTSRCPQRSPGGRCSPIPLRRWSPHLGPEIARPHAGRETRLLEDPKETCRPENSIGHHLYVHLGDQRSDCPIHLEAAIIASIHHIAVLRLRPSAILGTVCQESHGLPPLGRADHRNQPTTALKQHVSPTINLGWHLCTGPGFLDSFLASRITLPPPA